MRKAAMSLGVLGVLAAISGTALGGEPQAPQQQPTPAVPGVGATLKRAAPPVKITQVRRAGGGGVLPTPYTGGPLDVLVELENPSDKPVDNVKVRFGFGPSTSEQVVTVPAKKSFTVKFTDPLGLVSSCSPRIYDLNLAGEGTDTSPRKAQVTPTCTFSSKLVDAWNLAVPDRVEEQQKNHVFATNFKLETAPTCQQGAKLKGVIYNRSSLSSPSLIVQAKAGAVVKSQTAAAFPLAKGETKDVVLTPVAGANDVVEKLDVSITDWTHGLGNALLNQGITVTTTRSCTLAFALD